MLRAKGTNGGQGDERKSYKRPTLEGKHKESLTFPREYPRLDKASFATHTLTAISTDEVRMMKKFYVLNI